MPFAEINGISLYYEVHGQGPAVVLSHGIVGDTRSFAALLPTLTATYQVVVYDERGRGQSGDGAGAFSIADCAHDLKALLAYLGIPRAVHVGHSFGGRVALTLALEHAAVVQGLILMAVMSTAPPQGAHRPQDNFRALVEQHGVAAAIRYRVEHGFLHVADREAFLTHLEAERERYGRYSTTGFLRAAQAMATMPSLSERLSEISCPVLALAGEYDHPYLPFLSLYQERIPHCEALVVPHAGHLLVDDNAAMIQQAVGAFLHRVWPRRP